MRELHLHQFVNSFFSSNTYILYKEDEISAWLIVEILLPLSNGAKKKTRE